jgi:uncharacterized phage protein gp47/JayE
MATPVCVIDATGISKPTFADCLAYFVGQYQSIYGSDVYIDPDSQDGQWIGIQAQALDDANAMCVATYNAFSPSTAQGIGLSRVVKINGISRFIASYSTCDVQIIGTVGAVINQGLVQDTFSEALWQLPDNVIIPISGQITVTAICQGIGAVEAPVGSLTQIYTPTRGWQSVTNLVKASPGVPIETDAQLRIRQTKSTMQASQGILEGIVGSLMEISGVTGLRGYENDGNIPDVNGIPGHCIAIVIDGGDVNLIANVIAAKKSFAGTYGTTSIVTLSQFGISRNINFFRSIAVPIKWALTVKALNNFTLDTQNQIAQALVDWVNAAGIGNSLRYPRAYAPAQLLGTPAAETFELTALTVARGTDALGVVDIPIAFNEKAAASINDVTITVTV